MKTINNIESLILILILFMPLHFISADSKTKILKPKNAASKITIVIAGKNRTYYPLSVKDPTILTAKGPGKLTAITRAQFKSHDKNTLDYSVYYRIDGAEIINVDFKSNEIDTKSAYADNTLGFPGKNADVIINLGLGEHTIELWQGAENPNINARFLFAETKEKKIDWVQLSPLVPNEPVSLVTNEEVISYYRFSENKPLKIKITGPTTFRILSRIENHYTMKGKINYRLQVKEDGTVKHTYLLSSNRSDVTYYKNEGGKVPGKAKEIVIDVPGGTHIYEVIPLDKDKATVLARVLFPKKDVALEE